MRKTHFLLIGLLLFTCIAVNLTAPINADKAHGTRSPGAGVNVTSPSGDRTGNPTETVSYQFIVNNTGDEIDNFTISAQSDNNWLLNLSDDAVGPLGVNKSTTVTVNITIPMGIPADTIDNLTLSATSENDPTKIDQKSVNTTVEEAFVVELEIEGGSPQVSNVYPGVDRNYTLTLRNKGNEDVTITINHSVPSNGWNVTFPDFLNRKVFIEKATATIEGIKPVNMTVTSPSDAQPDDEMVLTVWAEKTDLPEPWTSETITITAIVQPSVGVIFRPEKIEGFVTSSDTLYPFTIQNTGNKPVTIDLVVETDNTLIVNLIDPDQMTLGVGGQRQNTLAVSTASNSPLGNYTVTISAVDNTTGTPQVVGNMELYYIIVPLLNITNISVSDAEPLQFRTTTLSATIENIGYVDAPDITVKFYDGKNMVGKKDLKDLNASDVAEASIKWVPSDFGNRTIRVTVDVNGVGNFSSHGTDLVESIITMKVKLNWQLYYLVIYVIIVVILGAAVFASMVTLRGGYSPLEKYATSQDEVDYEEDNEEGVDENMDKAPSPEGGEEEGGRAFGAFGMKSEAERYKEEPLPYKKPEEKPLSPAPEMRREPIVTPEMRREPITAPEMKREPFEREKAASKDPETLGKENDLRDEISKLQDRLDRAKSSGVDTTNIRPLLKTAEKRLSEGDHTKAKQYIGYANERLGNLRARWDEARNAIKEAKDVLSGIRGTTDLTIVENFLVKADSLFEEGDYKEATKYAKKAKDRAARLQRQEMRL